MDQSEPEPLSNMGLICSHHAAIRDPSLPNKPPAFFLGKNVKLSFPTGVKEHPRERMFVFVYFVKGGECIGLLNNDPLLVELKCGDTIAFSPDEAIAIEDGAEFVELPMRPLIIDDAMRAGIQKLIDHAQENRYPFSELKKIASGERPPPGDEYHLLLPFGWKVVFTIEQYPLEDGSGFVWVRHISVSVNSNGKLPSVTAFDTISAEFGFPSVLGKGCSNVWLEQEVGAINATLEIGKEKIDDNSTTK